MISSAHASLSAKIFKTALIIQNLVNYCAGAPINLKCVRKVDFHRAKDLCAAQGLRKGSLCNETTHKVVSKNAVLYEMEVGSELPVMLHTFTANLTGCYLDTPTGEIIEFLPINGSNNKYELRPSPPLSQCAVVIHNIDEKDHGVWRLHSVDEDSRSMEKLFNISVPSDVVREEHSEEISVEEKWQESYLDPQRFETSMGKKVSASIALVGAYETQGCFIRTPNGSDYALQKNTEIIGVERMEGNHISCGVTVNLVSADLAGEWMLMAREVAWNSDRVERRLAFTIYVEELVNTVPKKEATIVAGHNFYIRLEQGTDLHETCHFIGPSNDSSSRVEVNPRYVENCGFVVKNVQPNDAGKWEIVYGNNVTYRAVVQLNVYVNPYEPVIATETLSLTLDMPVNETLLPANAIYCTLQDPNGLKVFEGFGQCRLVLPRATSEHIGVWTMKLGVPGGIRLGVYRVFVYVAAPAPKATVTTHVHTTKPSVRLSCSVSSPHEVKACKFRDPDGEVFIANGGVGKDRYTFSVTHVNTSSANNYTCELELATTEISDLGLWRCAIETEEEAYYGFLSVLCPWAMQDPVIAAQVEANPVLKADLRSLSAIEGDQALLSCHAATPLTYCYLRAPNGTIFSVSSRTTTPAYSYAGAGLDAGECAIRFNSLSVRDSGRWACSVGHSVEESVSIAVEVHEQMNVSQYLNSNLSLVVSGQVFRQRALDYCRFVRIDGFGFSTDIPHQNPNYAFTGDLSNGECSLLLASPTILEHHPWTVVARLAGHDEEIVAVTPHSIVLPIVGYFRFPFILWVLIIFSIVLIISGLLMISKKNREWTYVRANMLRTSIRTSFRKVQLKDVETVNQTPNAA